MIHGVRLKATGRLLPRFESPRTWTHDLETSFEMSTALSELEHPLSGQLVAHQQWEGATEYAFARHGNQLEFLFPGFCAGTAHLQNGTLSIRAKSESDASLVLPNTVVSALLGPETDVTLHASAVARNGQTFGICGVSGAGKSSLATALSLAGYTVVSDDALRLSIDRTSAVMCFPGVPELRLRQTRSWILPRARLRQLPDERVGYLPSQYEHEVTVLRGLFFPSVSPKTPSPAVERLRGEQGLRQLLSASRISWIGTAGAHSFRLLARLHRLVPLYTLHLPTTYLDATNHPVELSNLLLSALEGLH